METSCSCSCSCILDLDDICLSHILSFTSPKDVCRASCVCKRFIAAGNSNRVWEKMLPPDYSQIISRTSSTTDRHQIDQLITSKKELFFHLATSPLIIDNGRKAFWIKMDTGKKCYMISAREHWITWGDDNRYWEWVNLPQSKFDEVAKLKYVWWFHVIAKTSTNDLSPNTNYGAYFSLKLDENKAEGFRRLPIKLRMTTFEEEVPGPTHETLGFFCRRGRQQRIPFVLRRRSEDWDEVEVGRFSTANIGDAIQFELMETDAYTKEGLVIQGIEIRPID